MSGLVNFLVTPKGEDAIPHKIRVNACGQVSVVDVITNICCLGPDDQPISSARQAALSYYNRLAKEHPEVKTQSFHFKFPGQGQRETPVTGRNGMLCIIQLLRGKKAAHFRQHMATLLEKYLDADLGLADDITDRALQAHMADLNAAKQSATQGEIPRLKSRDSTKELGEAIKQTGALPKYHSLFNGGVNTAVTVCQGIHRTQPG